jgi:hypothetical protein
VLLSLGVVAALTTSAAHAGTYSVVGGCGNWTAVNASPDYVSMYTECPALVVRNSDAALNSPPGAMGYWQFTAPPGTVIWNAQMAGDFITTAGWEAWIFTESGRMLDGCPQGIGCPRGFSFSSDPLHSSDLFLRLRCIMPSRCVNSGGVRGALVARTLVVNVLDTSPPALTLTDGDLLSGWRRGRGTVNLSASDNVGIQLDRLLVDGAVREQRPRSCQWGARIPCPNGTGTLSLDTTLLSDGLHTLSVETVDSAGNASGESRTILLDNTPPAAAMDLALAGGSAWRSTNSFSLSWRNPAQDHSAIGAARYELCPAGGAAAQQARCVTGQRSGPGISEIPNLAAPAPGAWRLRLWLLDEAGNADARTAVGTTLRFDNEPPRLSFRDQVANDPARLTVSAHDAIAGIKDVEVEARRRGSDAWTSLATRGSGDEYTAFMNDEELPAGLYDLRARAVDAAGNERTTMERSSGQVATVRLPVRLGASLEVGRASRRCTRGRCRTVLSRAPSLRFGQRARLTGQLSIERRRSTASRRIAVWRKLELSGAPWKHVGSVRTSPRGRFRYTVPAGPARLFRFRFPGSATVRGATAIVDVRVRAATTFEPSRRHVVNGEYVRFSGRLKGGLIPPGGKLVELQVFTRRRWRTFALPRADAKTGRWAFDYRFEAVRGRVQFRFRARIRRESGYPFHMGTSRVAPVTVHGL